MVNLLSFFTSFMPSTSPICFTTVSIFEGSTNSGFKVTSIDGGKISPSNNDSESIPNWGYAIVVASFAEINFF